MSRVRGPKLILDADGRIVAVLLGRPEGDDWNTVVEEMVRVFEAVRKRGIARGVFKPRHRRHRRSNFYVLKGGFTKGPGSKKPGNLAHPKAYRELLALISRNGAIRRLAGFQSSGLARYVPRLSRYYQTTLQGLLAHHPELEMLFPNSVFPTATFNLGPDVVCDEHLDMLNNPFGMCAVTSAGDFNHQRGGHIYLKQLKAVIEFPSGSSVLILSGACDHGNTPIAVGETRYSMTQYAAGALFRWAAYGYQTTKSLLAQPGGATKKLETVPVSITYSMIQGFLGCS
ncbi:hypothetical protein B0H12DRAFT_1205796 [Mycena haematopus]|nr:hypothetical protein B0H12DRAFT_1205796 [Mycena haematopus]